ncbi:MAG: hypothetical protein ACQCXQ_04885 [Verrucomicrobiales bacterium]
MAISAMKVTMMAAALIRVRLTMGRGRWLLIRKYAVAASTATARKPISIPPR